MNFIRELPSFDMFLKHLTNIKSYWEPLDTPLHVLTLSLASPRVFSRCHPHQEHTDQFSNRAHTIQHSNQVIR